MNHKLFLILAVLAMAALPSPAQDDNLLTELPDTTREAFVQSEKQVINTIDWLQNTPIDQDVDKRKTQMALLTAWLINSPTVTIEVSTDMISYADKNPELLITFMGGWTKYALTHDYSTDAVRCNLAGIRSVIEFYKNGNGLKKDRKMKAFIELDDKNELENWIARKLGG